MKITGIIAARYQSTRLKGKPLIDICGKPMLWWVYQNVIKVKEFNEVIVATEDDRVQLYCKQNNIPVVKTRNIHLTAANRLQEVSEAISSDYYVQINGDEPLIDNDVIQRIILKDVPNDSSYGANLITEIIDPKEINDISNIKVVFDNEMNALYLSRAPIPFQNNKNNSRYFKHLGIIGYNKKMLDFYANSKPGYLELTEGIDTMRFIDYGKKLELIIVENGSSLSVDTPKDLEKIREIMTKKLLERGYSLW